MLTGVHLLITYQCLLECDHCFVWSSPSSKGVMKLDNIRGLLREAKKIDTIKVITVEGGEPFLYYPIMLKTIKFASKLGFQTEIVTNSYWATNIKDANEWLHLLTEMGLNSMLISTDTYHGENMITPQAEIAMKAARKMNISLSISAVDTPQKLNEYPDEVNGVKVYKTEVMYRGRAPKQIQEGPPQKPWSTLIKCPYEDLANPTRVHVDPFGYIHVCQGISIGNAWLQPFSEIIQSYNPHSHPIIRQLIKKGPTGLVKKFNLSHEEKYFDACQLCYNARLSLRTQFPECLTPQQMYGEI